MFSEFGKGIETVRRDSCPLAQKILNRSLVMLFSGDPDLSKIKVGFYDLEEQKNNVQQQAYHQKQYRKIFAERISMQDFIFSKKVCPNALFFCACGSLTNPTQVGLFYSGNLPPAALVRESLKESVWNVNK